MKFETILERIGREMIRAGLADSASAAEQIGGTVVHQCVG